MHSHRHSQWFVHETGEKMSCDPVYTNASVNHAPGSVDQQRLSSLSLVYIAHFNMPVHLDISTKSEHQFKEYCYFFFYHVGSTMMIWWKFQIKILQCRTANFSLAKSEDFTFVVQCVESDHRSFCYILYFILHNILIV